MVMINQGTKLVLQLSTKPINSCRGPIQLIEYWNIHYIRRNLTWGHDQGFRKPINKDFIVAGQGSTGRFVSLLWITKSENSQEILISFFQSTERGLTLVEIEKAGHMVPQYQPRGAFQILQFLLGQTNSPSASWPSAWASADYRLYHGKIINRALRFASASAIPPF
jgi:hypothetical protein